ncbi:LOW QUALITY PROTEIN: uncharacterized protein LOC120220685 [Hyaena hyaena]|uniref:LOW QUALITY PROTEIN: uncharacterized protein LOC120220685 n=1 Tax=Hyaena hyaena TaxID=95912 RepID=UPI0019231C9D|nr:LOW QUALITY PROTEIN: uncharacterized protein LOC120220685 [Hyaena hyaena]
MDDPPPWLKHFLPPQVSPSSASAPVLVTSEKQVPPRKANSQQPESKPSASLYPVLQGETEEELIFPPLYQSPLQPAVNEAAAAAPPELPPEPPAGPSAPATGLNRGPARGTRSRCGATPEGPDSTVLPLRATGPPDAQGNQPHHYWPFATSDLYKWRSQNATFSENPRSLINLLETVLFTHQPTWDDCQQLLQVLFTTEEQERIQSEARKLVPGPTGVPTMDQACIDAHFPLTHPDWDYNTAEGKECLLGYRQALLAGLRAAAHKPTNMAKVYNVSQSSKESPTAFLERIMEAFRQYTPMDPEAKSSKSAVAMAFINQEAPDICLKLQKLERLVEKSLQDLVVVAERVYNNRESAENNKLGLKRDRTWTWQRYCWLP